MNDSDATLVRHNVAEDARSLIDDEVHRDCEYYVYSQLRDCIDVIDDENERLEADNAKLRELMADMLRYYAMPNDIDYRREADLLERAHEMGVDE